MKLGRSLTFVVAFTLITACGGGGSGGGDPAPTISNLSYAPTTALQLPGERTIISGTVDFADSAGNVVEMHLRTSTGDLLTVPISPPVGTEGKLTGSFSVSLDQIGQTSFEVWLQDGAGQVSNRLGGTFDVQINDTVPRWRQAPGQAELGRLLVTNSLHGLAWNGNTYVMVGSGVIVTSADLRTWRLQNVGGTLHSVAWSGSEFVAVGRESVRGGERDVLMRSSDGSTWTVSHLVDHCPEPPVGVIVPPCEYLAGLSKVIWAGSQFVAVGREKVPGVGTFALILTSPDGTAWTQRASQQIAVGTDVDPYGMGMTSVAWSGSLLVAVGRAADGTPAAWTSSNADAWSSAALPPPQAAAQNALQDVVWGHGQFVAVGWGGTLPPLAVTTSTLLSSQDGIGWRVTNVSPPLVEWSAAGVGPTRLLAVSTTHYATTPNGQQWTTTVNASTCGSDVIWDGVRWVGVGSNVVCVSP